MSRKTAKRIQADWPMHLSYDKSDSNIENFYSSVNGCITEKSSIFYGKRQIDIFLLAMAIGVEHNNREKVKKPSDSIRRDALTEKEVWMMCSVALAEESTLDILADSKELIRICQEYANGGVKTLMVMEKRGRSVGGEYEELLIKAIGKLDNATIDNN